MTTEQRIAPTPQCVISCFNQKDFPVKVPAGVPIFWFYYLMVVYTGIDILDTFFQLDPFICGFFFSSFSGTISTKYTSL